MKHRAISFITALALCLSLCPVRALAADDTDPGWSSTLPVTQDTTRPSTYEVAGSTRLDTRGNSYTVLDQPAVSVKSTGRLYLTTGKIESTVGTGIEVLKGGFLRVDQADMTVIGVTYGLEIASGTTVRLSGGTFTGQTAAIRAESGDYSALLVSGYAFFDESGKPIQLFDKDGNPVTSAEMAGKTTVTVEECTDHVYAYTAVAGAPTHGWTCLACGTQGTESCTFDFDGSDCPKCDKCSHTLKITIDPVEETYDGDPKPGSLSVKFELSGSEITLTEGSDYTVEYTCITDVGETTVTVTGDRGTYSGTYRTRFGVTRARPVIEWDSAVATPSKVYDGKPIDEAALLQKVIITAPDADELKKLVYFTYTKDGSSVDAPTDAGIYQIEANLPETDNYYAASTSSPLILYINEVNPVMTDAPAAKDLTYNGAARELVTGGTLDPRAAGAKILYALGTENSVNDSDFSETIPTATDAGEYFVWYKVEGTGNYEGVGPERIQVTIQRKPIKPAVLLEYYTTVYDGGFKVPKVTVKDGEMLIPADEYTVIYKDNQNAGTAAVTVKDIDAVTETNIDAGAAAKETGNYTIEEVSVEFDITPADQDALTIIKRPGAVTYGDVFTLETSGGSGNGTVTWEIVSPTPTSAEADAESVSATAKINKQSGQVTVTGVGTVTVRATKSGADSDGEKYVTATAEWTFTALPKRVTATVTAKSKPYDGNADTTVHAVVEQGVVPDDTITITGPDGAVLTGTFRDGPDAGTDKTVDVTGTVVITVNDEVVTGTGAGNEKYIITIPGTVAADIDKAEVTVTAPTSKAPTYSGEPQALVSAAGVAPKVPVTTSTPPTFTVEYAASRDGPWESVIPTGTDAGSYDVWYRVKESTNYLGTAPEKMVVTIDPQTVNTNDNPKNYTLTPDPEDDAYGYYVYDGTEKRPAVTVKDKKGNVIPATEYTVTYSNNVTAGTNTATVIITDNPGGNYKVSGEITFTIKSADAGLTGTPQAVADLVYNGQPQDLVTVGTAAGGSLEYACEKIGDAPAEDAGGGASEEETDGGLTETDSGLEFGSEIPQGTDAGLYKVYYRVKADGNHSGTGAVHIVYVTIRPKTVSSPVITLTPPEDGFTYDGTEQTFEKYGKGITVKDGADTIPSDEYSVTYSNNLNAGTATVHINDNSGGNYDVSGSKTFEIKKAKAGFATGKEPTARDLTYNGKAQALIDPGVPVGGTAVYARAEAGPYSTGIPTETDVGTYEVWAMVLGDANHEDSEPQQIKDVEIGKNTAANLTVELSSAVFRYNGGEQKPTVTVTDANGYVIPANEYTVEYLSFDPTQPEESEDPADPPEPAPAADIVNVGHYYVVVRSKTVNYEEFTKAVRVDILPAEQTPLTITGKPSLVRFGDLFSLDFTGGSGDGAVTWESSDTEVADVNSISGLVEATGVGAVTITVKKAASTDGNYREATAVWTFSVVQAAAKLATLPKPATGLIYNGSEQQLLLTGASTVNDIGEVKYSLDQNGTYSADFPTAANAGTYKVWYKVEGNDNYTDTAPDYVEVTIGRKELDAKASDLTVTWKNDAEEADGVKIVVTYVDDDGTTKVIARSEYTARVNTFNWEQEKWISVEVTAKENGNYKFNLTARIEHPVNEGFFEETDSPGVGGGDGPSISAPVGDGPGIVIAPTQTTVRDGAASTVVDGAAVDRLVDEAAANQSDRIVIKPEIDGGVTKTEVSIPASAVSRLGSETDAALTVSTPVADVTIPNAALETLSGAGGDLSVTAERVENTVVLALTADGEEIGDIPGGLTLTVPVEDAGPGTVAVLVHEDGTRETVRWSVAGDGVLRIPLDGSAALEIVDNSKEFADVSAEDGAADAVAFASAHELFKGTGRSTFSPEMLMTRGMLATVLYNLEGKPELEPTDTFSDVDSGVWYAAGISWAAANGIVGGYGDGRFGPDDNMTREQLAVMLWRYMGKPEASVQTLDFADADQVSGYAVKALCWAVESGILNSDGNGCIVPGGPATRAETAQMLRNFIENA